MGRITKKTEITLFDKLMGFPESCATKLIIYELCLEEFSLRKFT